MTWEYLVLGWLPEMSNSPEGWRTTDEPGPNRLAYDLTEAMNVLGREGWELVSVTQIQIPHREWPLHPKLFFKRPSPPA